MARMLEEVGVDPMRVVYTDRGAVLPPPCIDHDHEDWPLECGGCFYIVAQHDDEDWAREWLMEHRAWRAAQAGNGTGE